jgi:hypothetical protein
MVLSLLCVGLAVVWAAPAEAAPEKAEKALPKKIALEGLTIDGTVQKPQAFYVLPRSSLNYQGVERPPSFLPKIMKPLRKEPF